MEKVSFTGFNSMAKLSSTAMKRGRLSTIRDGLGVYKALRLGVPFYRTLRRTPIVDGEKTTTTINETIDSSVFDRFRRDESYRPRNIMQWAARHNIDPGELKDSVVAYDPSTTPP